MFPEPVISQAIEPKTKVDQDKLGTALARLAQEDPTFRMRTDEETQQTIIAGMGELHLEIILDRLKREFKVEANVGKPQVAYKEAITKTVEKQGKFVRQTGGKGQYGDVWLRLEPGEPNTGYVYVWAVVGGVIPKEYSKAIQEGIREASESGVLAGYPVLDFKATVFDGSFHDVDSSEMAFKIAGSMAFKEANRAAGPDLARADHESRSDDAEGLPRRDQRRPHEAPRHDSIERRSRGRSGRHHRERPALGNVRIRDGHAVRDTRSRDVHHGVLALREGAEVR